MNLRGRLDKLEQEFKQRELEIRKRLDAVFEQFTYTELDEYFKGDPKLEELCKKRGGERFFVQLCAILTPEERIAEGLEEETSPESDRSIISPMQVQPLNESQENLSDGSSNH